MNANARQAAGILNRMVHIRARIEEIENRIESLHDRAGRSTSSSEAGRTSGTGSRSRIESNIVDAVDLERQLAEMMNNLVAERKDIQSTIESMRQEDLKRILELRFIDQMSWSKIQDRMRISSSTSYRMYEDALTAFWEARTSCASENNL